jgi:dTDP-4-amino-4,6-dideoxygalactose transaminase
MGIPTRRGVMASHLEAPYRPERAALPHTEHAAATTFQLPMHPGLDEGQVGRVLAAIDKVAAQLP